MESEDERLDELFKKDFWEGCNVMQLFARWPELRAFEHEEFDAYREAHEAGSLSTCLGVHTCAAVRPSERPLDRIALCRVRRLFSVMKGFHLGDLDLTGRHSYRYQSAEKRFRGFVHDFKAMLPDSSGSIHEESRFETISIDAFDMFLVKWKCVGTYTPAEFHGLIEDTLAIIHKHPEPKFQKLLLTDLPPEVLSIVMQTLGDKDTMKSDLPLLGSTCRMLWNIAQNHIHTLKHLRVAFSPDFTLLDGKVSAEEKISHYSRALMQMEQRLIQNLHILLQSPDACQKIKHLSIDDDWVHIACQLPGRLEPGVRDQPEAMRRRRTISDLLSRVLSLTTNVREIEVGGWDVTLPLMHAMQSSKVLHTIKFTRCVADFQYTSNPFLSNVDTFGFSFPRGPSFSNIWSLVFLCTNLRYLAYADTSFNIHIQPDLIMPEAHLQAKFNLFAKLEAVIFDRLFPLDVEALSSWITVARPSGLRLKRFRLFVHGGLVRESILVLLTALSGAPMVSFILDGIRWADPALLDHISDAFPNLESLVLVYRDSDRQFNRKATAWPYPSWTYAQRLASFPCLRHFGWNLKIEQSYTTLMLPFLEEADPGPAAQSCFESPEEDATADEIEFEEGFRSIAKLLGSYCPLLQWPRTI
ncbi:hypothetical protein K474DRAFT_1711319 [Panus rudis PR-1116 ss-1]|nr:hypothetical protein K474DRAFT_1711319 [Panus rudis PR-1116 ss-1]